jgi:ribosomal protein S12 methylthiotransferase accessory factor YcaO
MIGSLQMSEDHASKGYTTGIHRLLPPRDTIERLAPLLPRMGITRLANVTGLDHIGIPVVMACRPNSRSVAVRQGKDMDLDGAKASAAMESIEGYHAERIALPLQFATYHEIEARRTVVDADLLPRPPGSHFEVTHYWEDLLRVADAPANRGPDALVLEQLQRDPAWRAPPTLPWAGPWRRNGHGASAFGSTRSPSWSSRPPSAGPRTWRVRKTCRPGWPGIS